MTGESDVFRRVTEQYMNAHDTAVAMLKQDIQRNSDKRWPEEFKRSLRNPIDHDTVSAEEFERLTDNDFETDEEVRRWFVRVWEYLYTDGPEPE